jgi:hypothetical protein
MPRKYKSHFNKNERMDTSQRAEEWMLYEVGQLYSQAVVDNSEPRMLSFESEWTGMARMMIALLGAEGRLRVKRVERLLRYDKEIVPPKRY